MESVVIPQVRLAQTAQLNNNFSDPYCEGTDS